MVCHVSTHAKVITSSTDAFLHAVDTLQESGVRIPADQLSSYKLIFDLGREYPRARKRGVFRNTAWKWVRDRVRARPRFFSSPKSLGEWTGFEI